MSDENTEEKKPEEQAPPLPWLLNQLDVINSMAVRGDKLNEITPLLWEIINRITWELYESKDNESVFFNSYNKEHQIMSVKGRSFSLGSNAPIASAVILDHLIFDIAVRFNTSNQDLLVEFWQMWLIKRCDAEGSNDVPKRELLDDFALRFFKDLRVETVRTLYQRVDGTSQSFREIPLILERYKLEEKYPPIYIITGLLEKLGEVDVELGNLGREIRIRAQNLQMEDLQKNLIDYKRFVFSTKQELTNLKNETESKTKLLSEGIEEAKDNENRMTRNFVQIIGIFAAIIAFIVTIVPTAVRMGGASIPIALAGLAIVTAGIVILLAMIFGKDERRKSLSKGLTGIIIAFTLWLTLTVVLAFVEPNVLRPPPDPVRVDTLYIDTVDTTPPPTPSTREGD